MRSFTSSLTLLSLLSVSLAAPAPSSKDAITLDERQLLGGLLPGVTNILGGIVGDINSAVAAGKPTAVANALKRVIPASHPTNIADVVTKQSAIWGQGSRTDFYQAVATQLAGGLILDGTLNQALSGAFPVGDNSINNNNPPPPTEIFPKKDSRDASYSLSDTELRKAIFIPSGFTYGQKPPVIFVPGTGAYGGNNFRDNLRKLLTGKSFADPVWLNIPGAQLGDTQTNSEYVAYAINYISAISGNSQEVAVISWSQGGLDTQWVLKYWPSTRSVVKDFLPVSPDFKGTVLANALCLSPNSDIGLNPLCPPSVVQQEATSDFVASLRRDNGDSAYVPTTTFYSGFFDEIVEPQQGTIASAFLNDVRGVGVSNNEVQRVCAGKLAGSFYGHAGVLFNPLTYALIVDALTHEGPGDPGRLDLDSVCNLYATDGLDLDDVLATTGLIPIAAALLLTYPEKRITEPPLRSYAQ